MKDQFTLGRPHWNHVEGAVFVHDVTPYEAMKLRMLNGAHSLIAYLGYLGGYTTVNQTMQNRHYKKMIQHFLYEEARPSLTMPTTHIDLKDYADGLINRFNNPHIQHTTWQIAMDGSQKIPQRWLNTIVDLLQLHKPFTVLALGIAAWMRYALGEDEQNTVIDVRDPMKNVFEKIAHQYHDDPTSTVHAFLKIKEIFPPPLASHLDFVHTVTQAYRGLMDMGSRQAVAALNASITHI